MATDKEAIRRKLDKQLEESRRIIEQLSANPDFSHAQQQKEMEAEIERLKAREQAAREKLAELEQAGGQAWEDIKEGAEEAWRHLDEAIKSAWSRFKQ